MIKYYNRKTKNYDIEQVAGDKYLTWTYSSPVGMFLLEKLIKKKGFSKLYGSYCNTKLSKSKIQKFINGFNIDTSQFEDAKDTFKCFNDFFYRKVKSEARPIDRTASSLISPGDGRLTAFTNINLNKLVQIKGITYSLYDFIKNDTVANTYNNGTCLILRLCPTDYHRFHFLDNGFCETSKSIKGHYYSVNPIALKKVKNLFCENKREWSLFHSENFGDVLYVEVGATCVGSIIQTYSPEKKVFKGDEKGYFKFGGSTIVLFFQEQKVNIHKDILEQSKLGFETKVSMGESIGINL
jgi:phosphatidylserine decarboxylase